MVICYNGHWQWTLPKCELFSWKSSGSASGVTSASDSGLIVRRGSAPQRSWFSLTKLKCDNALWGKNAPSFYDLPFFWYIYGSLSGFTSPKNHFFFNPINTVSSPLSWHASDKSTPCGKILQAGMQGPAGSMHRYRTGCRSSPTPPLEEHQGFVVTIIVHLLSVRFGNHPIWHKTECTTTVPNCTGKWSGQLTFRLLF